MTRTSGYTARLPRAALVAIALTLGGCAGFSRDGGYAFVESTARERLDKEVKWVRSDVDADNVQATVQKLLANPLSVEDAVQIALLNNRGLQAMYAELGIAEADLVQAGRLRNPRFSYRNVHGGSGRAGRCVIEWRERCPAPGL